MAEIRYEPVTPPVAFALVKAMRENDLNSILAAGAPIEASVLFAIRASGGTARVFYINDDLAGVWGVMPISFVESWVMPWVLTTDVVNKYKKTFYEESVRQVELLKTQYHKLSNMIDERYASSLAWAQRLGFKSFGPQRFGPVDGRFYEVIWERT